MHIPEVYVPFIRYTGKTDGEGSQSREYLPSCCVHKIPKIKRSSINTIPSRAQCVIFLSTQKCCSEIAPDFIFSLFPSKIISKDLVCFGRIGRNNFLQYAATSKEYQTRRARKKNSMFVIFPTDIIEEALISLKAIKIKT